MKFEQSLKSGALAALLAGPASAEPGAGIAMYGDPALPADFASLPYANPDAPLGGTMVSAEVGSFDSLNPYLVTGSVPWQLSSLITETLMGRSLDEPFTLYPLLAESVTTAPDRSWVEFQLRPEARFANGDPVTVDDVIWSYETLGTVGHPRYYTFWDKVASIEPVGERGLRITFDTPDRELAMLAGMRPVLQRSQWEGVDFATASGLDIIPVTSAEYQIAEFDPGRSVTLRRNPDYWGADIPFRRGSGNLDEIRIEFFADETAARESLATGETSLIRETNPQRWATDYAFPRVRSGEVTLSVIPHSRPSGMTGLVMNTREGRPFADWRVRDAMILLFDYESIVESVTGEAQPRIASYFSNSPLAMGAGPASPRVAELLAPYEADLVPGALDAYALPVGDGGRNRANAAAALDRLEEAGWTVAEDGVLRDAAGEPFAFEILLQSGGSEVASIVDMYEQSLEGVGMDVTVTAVDSAQYKERTDAYDFDMTYYRRDMSLSPGNEQTLYFGSSAADAPGGRNLMGVRSPAVDGLIATLLNSESQDDFVAAAQALDRVLTTGRYVVPFYQWNVARIAHDSRLRFPDRLPLQGDVPPWQTDFWWWQE